MFFFYSFHYKRQAVAPTVYAQPYLRVISQLIPVRLVVFVAMYALHYHHKVIIFENQWIVVDKSFQVSVQLGLRFLKHLLV